MRVLVLLYGVASYALFFVTFLYAIAFTGNIATVYHLVSVPKTIDSGVVGSLVPSLIVNAILLGLFAVQHTVMARPAFKAWWTKIIPPAVERSTFVLVTSLLLLLLFWQWRPLPDSAWQLDSPLARRILSILFWLGWGTVFYSTWLINHFDLFGLRQSWLFFRGKAYTPVPFRETSLYRLIRHPLMLGFIVAFWAEPYMSVGHLFFAVMTTGYVLIAIQIEERDLVKAHGDRYQAYQRRVSMLIPLAKRSGRTAPTENRA